MGLPIQLLLLLLGPLQELYHNQAASVVRPIEFYFIHQRADYLKSSPPLRGAANGRGRSVRRSGKSVALVGHRYCQAILGNAKPLVYSAVGALAVLGGIDARFDQSGLD